MKNVLSLQCQHFVVRGEAVNIFYNTEKIDCREEKKNKEEGKREKRREREREGGERTTVEEGKSQRIRGRKDV